MPLAGLLALQPCPAPAVTRPVPVPEVVDRLLVGRSAEGAPEVRMTLASGAWGGAEVRLTALPEGVRGVVVAPTEAVRAAVEAQLAELGRALGKRGTVRVEVAPRRPRERPR